MLKQGHRESCFRAKYFGGKTVTGVKWIGTRERSSQDCDLSSLQSFLWERPGSEEPRLLCDSHGSLFWELSLGSTKKLSLHSSIKQRVAVQNSSCGITHCEWLCKILKVLPFTSCWKNRFILRIWFRMLSFLMFSAKLLSLLFKRSFFPGFETLLLQRGIFFCTTK